MSTTIMTNTLHDELLEPINPGLDADGYEALEKRYQSAREKVGALVRVGNEKGGMDEREEREYVAAQEELERAAQQRDRYLKTLRTIHQSDKLAKLRLSGARPVMRSEQEARLHERGLERIERECQATPEYRDAFDHYLRHGERTSGDHLRAMTVGVEADGGYLPAVEFVPLLLESMDQETVVEKIATKMQVGSFKSDIPIEEDIGVSQVNTAWQTETGAASEHTPQYGQVLMTPHDRRVLIKPSLKLIQDAPSRGPGFSIESIVAKRLGRLYGLMREWAFCNGLPADNQPKGIFTYTSGSGTTISVGHTTAHNGFTADDWIKFVYSIPMKYRWLPGCHILVHDSTLGMLAELKNVGAGGSGYLMQPSNIDERIAGRIRGVPIIASPYAPAFAADTRFAVIGDFRQYLIADRTSLSLQVLYELYAPTGQRGYLATFRCDGKATRMDAFRYLKSDAAP